MILLKVKSEHITSLLKFPSSLKAYGHQALCDLASGFTSVSDLLSYYSCFWLISCGFTGLFFVPQKHQPRSSCKAFPLPRLFSPYFLGSLQLLTSHLLKKTYPNHSNSSPELPFQHSQFNLLYTASLFSFSYYSSPSKIL